MRSIEISEETFRRLRQVAKSDETSELVIRRLLDAEGSGSDLDGEFKEKERILAEWERRLTKWEKRLVSKGGDLAPPAENVQIRSFSIGRLPQSVTHTKIFKAVLDDRPVPKSALGWTPLICEILKIMHHKGNFSPHKHYPDINIAKGSRSDSGYSYVPEIDCSVQGVDANKALRCIAGFAQDNFISVDVTFGWRDKKGALHPGEYGRILD